MTNLKSKEKEEEIVGFLSRLQMFFKQQFDMVVIIRYEIEEIKTTIFFSLLVFFFFSRKLNNYAAALKKKFGVSLDTPMKVLEYI